MTGKERALTEAGVAATAAGTAFCTASTTYIPAIDRYGDVLNATAPTVGDVKDAGSDLAQPGKDAEQAAHSVADSRQAVASAEQELADAQATLVTAQASAAGTTPTPTASRTPSPSPTATPVSVTRVQKAEAEFGAEQRGITDNNPLAQAAEQFNAATMESHTGILQQALGDAGYSKKKVDGVYGPETVAAVQALQKDLGVPVTGTVEAATIAAFEQAVADAGTSPSPSRSVSAPPGPTESS